jgi:hypothetical protein
LYISNFNWTIKRIRIKSPVESIDEYAAHYMSREGVTAKLRRGNKAEEEQGVDNRNEMGIPD